MKCAIDYMNKKKTAIIVAIVLIILGLAGTVLFLYERAQIATIIDDELAWDLRDAALSASGELPDSTSVSAGENECLQ